MTYVTRLMLDPKERTLTITALAYMTKDYLERANGYLDVIPENLIKNQLLENARLCKELRLRLSAIRATDESVLL